MQQEVVGYHDGGHGREHGSDEVQEALEVADGCENRKRRSDDSRHDAARARIEALVKCVRGNAS